MNPVEPTTQAGFGYLRQHVYAESGIVLDAEKEYLLEARLAPILREQGLACLNDLCALLIATRSSPLHRTVVDAMTTNETYFFREPAHYETLRNCILPDLLELRRSSRRLSFWSAAASTGQEAYSLAMLLLEMGLGNWNIEILGTDLSMRVLEQARTGRYSQLEVNRGLPAALLVKYFRRSGLYWELREEVRQMVRFQSCDLRSPSNALGPFDAVFCRNVLIYFDPATKRRVLEAIHKSIFRGGHLLLGTTEAGTTSSDLYKRLVLGNTVVYSAV